jgi:hypothetical protein
LSIQAQDQASEKEDKMIEENQQSERKRGERGSQEKCSKKSNK